MECLGWIQLKLHFLSLTTFKIIFAALWMMSCFSLCKPFPGETQRCKLIATLSSFSIHVQMSSTFRFQQFKALRLAFIRPRPQSRNTLYFFRIPIIRRIFFSFLENVYLVENTPALIIEYYDINIFIEKSILIYPPLSILSGILHCTERTLFKKNKKNANYNQLECLGEWFMTLLSLDLLWKSSL